MLNEADRNANDRNAKEEDFELNVIIETCDLAALSIKHVLLWHGMKVSYHCKTILSILLDLAVKLEHPINITSRTAHLVLDEISKEKEAFSRLFSLPH